MKQSNWILGIGIVVALILIIGSIWYNVNTEEPLQNVINKPASEVGHLKNVVMKPIGQFIGLISRIR